MIQKPPVVYNCEACLYITDNKKDYIRHLETRKHKSNGDNIVAVDKNTCAICNKVFKSRTSIYKHKPICKGPSTQTSDHAEPDPASLTIGQIKNLMMENKMLKELLKNAGVSS